MSNKRQGPDSWAFDVSDGALIDPVRRVNLNEEGNWRFREKANVDPEQSGRLLGGVMIGKVPNEVTYAQFSSSESTVSRSNSTLIGL
ncbi:uncharacterized protein N7479_009892 [Penicillium vulpinum]|uniref:uncharacterized protein n=1 Tax=Penicillium vulpinum TaxID=29845 RepID=UPI0025481018|nr:uncharacterized protein N7479_009892 [Penicillium vulpinum]KAJ5951479.1 hypothetical protein N7479_009892 [Penicillium vulpinum]